MAAKPAISSAATICLWPPISIKHLEASPVATFVDHVDVIWTATHPQKRGRWVVGWYCDGRVYRERAKFKKPPSTQHHLETHQTNYRIRTKAGNAIVIPPKQRDIPLGRGKGWIGQANWWFPELSPNPAVKPFLRKVHTLLRSGLPVETPSLSGARGGWGGKGDPQRKAQVELAATDVVRKHFAGHRIKSVEKDNLGWDLEARRRGNKNALRLEVKGLFGDALQVGLTPGEYRAFTAHMDGAMANYRLCVVTRALSGNPKLVIFRFNRDKQGWIDDQSGRAVAPKIKPVLAAVVSLG